MSGEKNLNHLMRSMEPTLQPETFVFVTTKTPENIDCANIKMLFKEQEGTTLILPMQEANKLDLAPIFPCQMITLNIHSSLDAVGFIARIASHLASCGIGVNPVSAYFHDHLFVSEDHVDIAMEQLRKLSAPSR